MENDRIYKNVVSAVCTTFEQMGVEQVEHKELEEGFDHHLHDGLCVIVGFSGEDFKGVVALYYNQDLAMYLAKKVFQIESEDVNEDVWDSCGEISNMICGMLKNKSVESGVADYNITVPTIIGGSSYNVGFQSKRSSKIFAFEIESDKGRLLVELKLEPLSASLKGGA